MKSNFIFLVGILFPSNLIVNSINSCENDGHLLNSIEDGNIEWSYTVPHYGNITIFEKIVCREDPSQRLAWLQYHNFHQCVTFVTDISVPSCMYTQFERNNLTVISKNRKFISENLELRQLHGPKCDTFMILTQNYNFLEAILGKGMKHHFPPFTNIFLFVPKAMIIPEYLVQRAIHHGYNLFTLRNSFFNRTMPYFNLNYRYLTNLATNQTLHTHSKNQKEFGKFFGTVEDHPLFNKSINKEKPLRVGLFDCSPYVRVKDAKKKIFDGLEYWFVEDVTRGWNVEYNVYNKNWINVLNTVHEHENDMALCSIWLTERNHNSFSLSSYFDQQCLTMMVPRQKAINAAAVIYLSLKSSIWLYFGIAFVSIAFVLVGITKIGIHYKMYEPKNLPFRTLSNAFLEVVNIMTSHGMTHFPLQISIKFAILSWFIFSLLFGVIYSSGYVSLITRPPLIKPIDSVEDFVKRKLKVGELEDITPLQKQLMFYNYSVYTALAKRVKHEDTTQIRLQHIQSGKYGYMVTKLSNHYITNVPLRDSIKIIPMRLMKSCLMKFFSTLAFAPQSPYCSFFSRKLAR